MKYIISYDLGTGGTKTSLFDENGRSHASAFTCCDTFFPGPGMREQNPLDWWNSVVTSTRAMLKKTGVNTEDIVALAVSGHSLGVVPIGGGKLLADRVPIWNDTRAHAQAKEFFQTTDENQWYLTTGSGFPAPLYSIFKIMWYRDNQPELYQKTDQFIGTKDYINFCMTGKFCTDRSYASGSGVWSLAEEKYRDDYIKTAGVAKSKLPDVYPSTHVIGTLTKEAADTLGLSIHTKVCAGGVDNACMALGAACITNGEAYTSLGTSSWIAVSGDSPIVSIEKRPYVFAHCVPGQYVSATSIFSAGNSFRWVRNNLCQDLIIAEQNGGPDSYQEMDRLAEQSPAGANRLIFNPSLAGGSGLDKSANIRGCFTGLDLMHTRSDIIRATLEGVCFNLRIALDVLESCIPLQNQILLVGGGGKSQFWRQLFADIYEKEILETNIGEDAGSLGAAVVAAVGSGLWSGFDRVKEVHILKNKLFPVESEVKVYRRILPVFARIAEYQCDIGDMLSHLSSSP